MFKFQQIVALIVLFVIVHTLAVPFDIETNEIDRINKVVDAENEARPSGKS